MRGAKRRPRSATACPARIPLVGRGDPQAYQAVSSTSATFSGVSARTWPNIWKICMQHRAAHLRGESAGGDWSGGAPRFPLPDQRCSERRRPPGNERVFRYVHVQQCRARRTAHDAARPARRRAVRPRGPRLISEQLEIEPPANTAASCRSPLGRQAGLFITISSATMLLFTLARPRPTTRAQATCDQ